MECEKMWRYKIHNVPVRDREQKTNEAYPKDSRKHSIRYDPNDHLFTNCVYS